MEAVLKMMAVMYVSNTSPGPGLSLLVLVLMNSVLAMAGIEQVIGEEGITRMMVNHISVVIYS